MTNIPILDMTPEIDALWDEINAAIQRVLRSGAFIMGPDVKAFETEVAAYLGVKHAIGVNSGTDALVIGLRALGINPGDEIITTPFTFFATAEAISAVGATPVFVDIDPLTFNLDPKLIEAAITARTKAIIPVHLFGHAVEMDPIMTLAKKHNLKVLEDVAQAFSGVYNGNHLGTIGEIGAYSFFPSKNLGAFGDGGLITTNDDALAEACRMLRVHGAKQKYYNEIVGYNSRLDTVQAAVLRVKLPRIEEASMGRRRVAGLYSELLGDVKGIALPVEKAGSRHVYHQYTVRILNGKRDAAQQALQAAGVSTMVYYPVPCHKLPIYRAMDLHLPVSEQAAAEVLSLPIWPTLERQVALRVVEAVKRALGPQ